MPFITVILKEGQVMSNKTNHVVSPFWVMVNKEISDIVRSWRFLIMLGIIVLTCMGSLYAALHDFANAFKPGEPEDSFFFLKLFTHSDGTLPSYIVFISFLGPLLGISMGFDSINTEQNKGTLSRVLAQPIYRDFILNAKFVAALIVLAVLFFSLSFLVMGFGLIFIGIPPTPEEFLRIIVFTLVSVVYVAFWLNLSILFSVRFKQAATAALSGIAVWLFFTIFYGIIVNLIASAMAPSVFLTENQVVGFQRFVQNLLRLNPGQLFDDAVTSLLVPMVRSLGPLTTEQMSGAIPSPLPLGQSLMLVWPQATALIAGTIVFFALAYTMFMRREIRSR